MDNFQQLETPVLFDMLAKHTADFTRMINEKTTGEEYDKCKLLIKALQTEIDFRKNIADVGGTNITPPPDFS